MKSGNPDRGGKIDKKIVRAGRPAVALGTLSAARIYWDGAKCNI